MTLETLAALFTREALRPFQPPPGSDGLTPMLDVFTETEAVVFVLSMADFNDGAKRHDILRQLGVTCAQQGHAVEAVRLGSEAWMRRFTAEDYAARGQRPIDTYADKTEALLVFGQLATGDLMMAMAPLYRRTSGAVERVGPWTVEGPGGTTRLRAPLLEAFWEGYRHGKSEGHW